MRPQKAEVLVAVAVKQPVPGGPFPVQALGQHAQHAAQQQQRHVGPAGAQQRQLGAGGGQAPYPPQHRQHRRHRLRGPDEHQQAQHQPDAERYPPRGPPVPAPRQQQQPRVARKQVVMRHGRVVHGVLQVIGSQHQRHQHQRGHHIREVVQQQAAQQPQAQQRVEQATEGNGNLVGGRKAILRVALPAGGPVPKPEKGRPEQRQANRVLHHELPGRRARHLKRLVK